MAEDDKANKFDLIDVNGPLTVESILRCLQQRFSSKQYYVSGWKLKVDRCLVGLVLS